MAVVERHHLTRTFEPSHCCRRGHGGTPVQFGFAFAEAWTGWSEVVLIESRPALACSAASRFQLDR